MKNQNKENLDVLEEQKDQSEITEKELEEKFQEDENTEISEQEEKEEEQEEEYTGKKAIISMRYDFKAMKYFHIYTNFYRRKIYIRYIILIVLTLAAAAFLTIDSINKAEEITYQLFIIPAIFVLIAAYIAYQSFNIENNLDKRLAMIFTRQKPAELHFEIREDKIKIVPLQKPEEVFSYDWVQISAISEIPQYYFFYYGKTPLMIIEKNPDLMIEGTFETVEEIIKDKIAFKPYHFLEKEIITKPITFVEPSYEVIEDTLENENAEENENSDQETEILDAEKESTDKK